MPAFELPDKTLVHSSDTVCLLPEEFVISSSTSVIDRLPLPTQQQLLLPPHSLKFKYNSDTDSLQELIMTCIAKCDVDVRRDLLTNMIICGGGSLIDGLLPRLNSELSALLPVSMKSKQVSLLEIERRFSSWIGGSILSVCGTFQQLWLSKKEYDEYGPNIFAKRFNK